MLGDTIWAVGSPPGAAPRGVIRISGPAAFAVAARACGGDVPRDRLAIEVTVGVAGFRVPALLLAMPGPRSFTAEDVVELHLPGAPLLLERVGASLAARRALPGEFTRRAFENGRLSLDQAEAVLDLIHAADGEEARRAAARLSGGLRTAVAALRARIDDARAMLEAGLDFTEGETGEVDTELWAGPLGVVLTELDALREGLPRAAPGGDLLLLGAANAGKSSLCNALAGREAVLVSERPGTTRDVVAVEIACGVRLLDAPGDVDDAAELDRGVLSHRDEVAGSAAGALLVVDPTRTPPRVPDARGLPVVAVVLTRGDIEPRPAVPPGAPAGVPVFVVGCHDGAGVDALAAFLARRGTGPEGGGVRLDAALGRARAAIAGALGAPEPELAAFELAEAMTALDEIDGRSSPEDLLDRIFARFCMGK